MDLDVDKQKHHYIFVTFLLYFLHIFMFISGTAKTFPCLKCGKVFKRSDALRRHSQIICVKNKTSHICQTCNKQFRSSWYVKRHMKIHMSPAPALLVPALPDTHSPASDSEPMYVKTSAMFTLPRGVLQGATADQVSC